MGAVDEVIALFEIIGFFALVGVAIFGVGLVGFLMIDSNFVNSESYQQSLAEINATYQECYANLSSGFNLYEATFNAEEPSVTARNLTEFMALCSEWNKSAVLYDMFQRRRTGFLGLTTRHSGYFWFQFQDNGITVQARLMLQVERIENESA